MAGPKDRSNGYNQGRRDAASGAGNMRENAGGPVGSFLDCFLPDNSDWEEGYDEGYNDDDDDD